MPKVKSDPDMLLQDKQKVDSLEKDFVLVAHGDAPDALPATEVSTQYGVNSVHVQLSVC